MAGGGAGLGGIGTERKLSKRRTESRGSGARYKEVVPSNRRSEGERGGVYQSGGLGAKTLGPFEAHAQACLVEQYLIE